MRRIAQGALALLIVLGGMAFTTGTAQACSCVAGGADEYYQWADAVFSGEIVDRTGERLENAGKNVFAPGSFTYTVEVDAVFKGDVAARQKVVAGTQESACGIVFPKSGPILVYGIAPGTSSAGNGAPDTYGTGLCSGSTATAAVPAVFGEGEPPIGAESSAPAPAPLPTAPAVDIGTATGSTWATMFGIALLASLLIAGGVYLAQRRHR